VSTSGVPTGKVLHMPLCVNSAHCCDEEKGGDSELALCFFVT
jgi:hypothetical protein